VQPVTAIKSDTRLSPLSMSSYKDDNGLMRTFFTKYGLVGNRFTDKEKYHIPPAVTTTEANTKGDATSWASSSMYASSDCSGDVVSVAGIAGPECIPLSGFGGDGSNSFMVDCRCVCLPLSPLCDAHLTEPLFDVSLHDVAAARK
jgi:hypothetical protein